MTHSVDQRSIEAASVSSEQANNVKHVDPQTQTAASGGAHTYTMTASCTVRDCVALKAALLDLLPIAEPVTVDLHAIERIDTAALQVLCAFVRDRQAAGGTTLWIGGNDHFGEAVRLLGLQTALGVSDVELAGAAA
jgi:ABC-type transporter Mla MlaB component